MENSRTALLSNRIITPIEEIKDAVVLIEGQKIKAVGRKRNITIPSEYHQIDVGDKIIAPGLIDIHNHGGLGMMVSFDGEKAVRDNAARLVEVGCTGWLPTVNSLDSIPGIVNCIKSGTKGTEILGIHLEGPFLTPKDIKQIKNIDYGLETPTLERFLEYYDAAEGYLRIMGVSVELDGVDEIIIKMRELGVLPAIAHSTKASYEQFLHGVELGIRHVTHTYNVMTGLHHRKPGVVGGALTCDQVTNELISDGQHVSAPAMDILVRCKGKENICLISDNTAVAGLPDGEYDLQGRKLIKLDGVTRFADSTPDMDHTMAGSEWPINHNVKILTNEVGVSLKDSIQMATLNPARIIGLDGTKGSIEPGKDADIIVVDTNMHVYMAFVKGELSFGDALV
jgi:N-acetylglucosamine-6-phosphate deacetylase